MWTIGPRFSCTTLNLVVASLVVASVTCFGLPSSPCDCLRQQAVLRYRHQSKVLGQKTAHSSMGGIRRTRRVLMLSSRKERTPSPSPSSSALWMPISSERSTTRGRAVAVSLSAWIAGLTSASGWSHALDPVKKTQEWIRIRRQEKFDNNALGAGELASPEGGKTIQPVLALIPIVTLRLQFEEVEKYLEKPSTFSDALNILKTQDFQKKEIKRAFNLYSDNIYYLSGSDRENKYLQGGATPSTRQTLQYLLRNDIIDNVEALTAEIAFLIREREAAASGSGKAADLDESDLRVYLAKCKTSFDKYLGMIYQNEIDEATDYAKMALAARKKSQTT